MIIQNSALRLLEIIKTLIASPKTREEICFELDKKGEGIYKNTVSNTLGAAGGVSTGAAAMMEQKEAAEKERAQEAEGLNDEAAFAEEE